MRYAPLFTPLMEPPRATIMSSFVMSMPERRIKSRTDCIRSSSWSIISRQSLILSASTNSSSLRTSLSFSNRDSFVEVEPGLMVSRCLICSLMAVYLASGRTSVTSIWQVTGPLFLMPLWVLGPQWKESPLCRVVRTSSGVPSSTTISISPSTM